MSKKLQAEQSNLAGATTMDVRNDGPMFQHNDAKIMKGWIFILTHEKYITISWLLTSQLVTKTHLFVRK